MTYQTLAALALASLAILKASIYARAIWLTMRGRRTALECELDRLSLAAVAAATATASAIINMAMH